MSASLPLRAAQGTRLVPKVFVVLLAGGTARFDPRASEGFKRAGPYASKTW